MYPESCHNVTFFFNFKKTFCQSSTSYFVLMDLMNFFFLLIMCNICMTSYQQQLFIQFRQNMHILVYIIFIPVDYLLIGEKSCKIFQRHYLRYLCSPVVMWPSLSIVIYMYVGNKPVSFSITVHAENQTFAARIINFFLHILLHDN